MHRAQQRHGLRQRVGHLDERTEDGVEFDRPACHGVLVHRGAHVADLARVRNALHGVQCRVDAGSTADRDGLAHHADEQRVHFGRIDERVQVRPRDEAYRVETGVAQQLDPDLAPHIGCDPRIEAGLGEERGDAVDAPTRAAGGFAENQRVAAGSQFGVRGRRRRARHVDHAAHHARERHRRLDGAAGVDREQPPTCQRPGAREEDPPWQPVDRGHDHRIRPAHRSHCGRHLRQRGGLDRHDQQFLGAQRLGAVAAARVHHVAVAPVVKPPAAAAQGLKRGPAGQHADRVARTRQPHAQAAADGACTDDPDPHGPLPSRFRWRHSIGASAPGKGLRSLLRHSPHASVGGCPRAMAARVRCLGPLPREPLRRAPRWDCRASRGRRR